MAAFFKDYNAATDEQICAAMLKIVSTDLPKTTSKNNWEIQKNTKAIFLNMQPMPIKNQFSLHKKR